MTVSATLPEVTMYTGLLSSSYIFYFLLIPVLVLWYTYWRLSRRKMVELAEKLPGPKGWPLIGNALEFIGSSPGK